ncbi:MAG: hypothetical protein ABIQ41_07805 [Gemmatimonadales bacterium]
MSISKFRLLTLALVVGCAAPPVATTVSAQTYQCATATNDEASGLQTYIASVVAGSDSASIQDRAQYQLPVTTASKVVFLTRASDCRTAAQHFYTALGTTPPTSGTIVVIALKVASNRYVVTVVGVNVGEFTPALTFDSKWKLLANVVG